MYLKYYEGNCEDLGLTFAVSEEIYGKVRTIPLKKDGFNIPVTK